MEKATIGLTMWMSLELPVLRGNLVLGYAHLWQPNRLLCARCMWLKPSFLVEWQLEGFRE